MPNVQLRVDVVGEGPRVDGDGAAVPEAPNRPAFASQTVDLGVSTASRGLAVDVAPASAYVEPGTEAEVDVRVETSDGEPASGAQVAVAVVDEAVLAAADYDVGDPLESFYPRSEGGVRARLFRESVLLASLDAFDVGGRAPETHRQMQMRSASGAEETADSERGGEIALRRDFRPLAHFEPALETSDDGRASLQFEMPDNVTRYRILAVAASGSERFGTGSDHLTAQLPVRVEPSMPRLLRWGDRADLPVLVHNQTEQKREVRIAARTANLSLQEPRGVRLTVPAKDRVEYRFASETDRPGTARVQFGLASERRNDAAEVEIPVRTPGTRESFAAHGTLDEGVAVRSVQVPADALPSFGGLDVTTSSTALQELADAFLYVVDAPYECTEMYASRVLAIDALRDVSEAFRTDEMPDDAELESTMREDLDALVHLQRDTGGFPVWKRSNESDPYVSVHAAHALATGVDRGLDGLREPLRRAVEYLRDIDEHVPKNWSQEVRSSVEAYAHYVLRKAGAPQPGRVAELADGTIGEELSVEAAAWLVSTLAAMPSGGAELQRLRRKLEDRVVEESGAAHVTAEYEESEHLVMHSSSRADALALEALLRVSAPDDLLEKFVQGLLGDRTKGRWAGTQENVFALRALKAYFDEKESETPDFGADLWLGEGYLGRHEYRERTVRRKQVRIPMSVLRDRADGGRMSLRLDHSGGVGRMYYRIALDSVSRSRQLEPVERGFAVERRYDSVDGKEEVRREEDGSWRIEAGSRVRVEVEMVVPSERHHVALEDPVAAGFEPLNPAVATTEPVPGDGSTDVDLPWWRLGPWFEHQNLREERAEAFTTELEAGVYSYSYVVRATTPGEFVVPRPTAREMYHPETHGRGATDRITIVPSQDE